MDQLPTQGADRKNIAIRLLFTVLFIVVFEILKMIIQLAVLFQYIFLLVTRRHHEPVRVFSNKVSTYAYRVLRYMTLNENMKPFPFTDFPPEVESPESDIRFK